MSERVMVFIPSYRCAPQIGRVVGQIDSDIAALVDEVIVVDNQSPDETPAAAEAALRQLRGVPWRLLENEENYGLGGSHKVAISEALDGGFDWLIVLHGDDQAAIADITPLLRAGVLRDYDALLGSRFMRGSRLEGYSRVRTVGNHIYNGLFSLAGGRRLHDLGSGLNAFRVERFRAQEHRRFADDLTFNYYLSLFMCDQRWRMRFFPITWREEDQRSNVKLVQQGLRTLRLLASYARGHERFFAESHAPAGRAYAARVLASGSSPL